MREPYGPPTPDQLRRAEELGLTVPPGTTKLALSDMIDQAPPSERQLHLAGLLNITVPVGATVGWLNRHLPAELNRQGALVLKNNPAVAQGKYIMYNGKVYEVIQINWHPNRLTVSIRPEEGGRAKPVAAFSLHDAYEVDRSGRK